MKQSPSSTSSNTSATPKVGDNSETPNSQGTKKTPGRQKAKFFPEESIPDLIRLVHGNSYNKMFLTREFSAFLQNSTKSESKGNIRYYNTAYVPNNAKSSKLKYEPTILYSSYMF